MFDFGGLYCGGCTVVVVLSNCWPVVVSGDGRINTIIHFHPKGFPTASLHKNLLISMLHYCCMFKRGILHSILKGIIFNCCTICQSLCCTIVALYVKAF